MNKKKFVRIAVPICMVAIIAFIWFIQNLDNEVTTENEYPLHVSSVDIAALSEYNLPMIIDFGATECIPCKDMAPVLETLNAEMQGKAIVQFVDVWENPQAAQGFYVPTIPTQILYNSDGTPYVPSLEVAESIAIYMYAHQETEEHVLTAHHGSLTEEDMRLVLADMGVE